MKSIKFSAFTILALHGGNKCNSPSKYLNIISMPGGGEDRFLMFNGQVLIIFMGRSFRFTIYHISRGGAGVYAL
jgi:hypothetical protein